MANNVWHSILIKTGDVQQVLEAARQLITVRGEMQVHDGLIKFGTAWVPPVEAFKSLAARFPDYDIIVHGACVEDCQHFVFSLHDGIAEGRDCPCGGVDDPDCPVYTGTRRLTLNQNTTEVEGADGDIKTEEQFRADKTAMRECLSKAIGEAFAGLSGKLHGPCEISSYFPDVVCNDSAMHIWGHGSLIQVCETHAKWNPDNASALPVADLSRVGTPQTESF
jgi:hypothetical protein